MCVCVCVCVCVKRFNELDFCLLVSTMCFYTSKHKNMSINTNPLTPTTLNLLESTLSQRHDVDSTLIQC